MLHSTIARSIGLIMLLILLILLFFCSLAMGQTGISFHLAWEVITQYNSENTEHLIVATSRFARASIALSVGMALSIAGLLTQTLTRNPLASPDLLGINSGAIFFIVFAITWLDIQSLQGYMWFGFLGAAIAGIGVFLLSNFGRDGLTPLKVILAGTALSAFFVSFTQGMLVIDEQSIQTVLFWIAGSIAGRELEMLISVLPLMLLALVGSLLLAKSLNIFRSGDDIAKSLGQNVVLLKFVMGILIIILAGSSVAIAGSIGFIGLIVPHMAKGLVGNDYRWTLPFTALIGASLLILADTVARFFIIPMEVPIGVMTALIGGPFFVYLARKEVSKK